MAAKKKAAKKRKLGMTIKGKKPGPSKATKAFSKALSKVGKKAPFKKAPKTKAEKIKVYEF